MHPGAFPHALRCTYRGFLQILALFLWLIAHGIQGSEEYCLSSLFCVFSSCNQKEKSAYSGNKQRDTSTRSICMEVLHCPVMQDQPWFLQGDLGRHAGRERARLDLGNTEICSYHFLVEEDSLFVYLTAFSFSKSRHNEGNWVFQTIAPPSSR